MRWAAAYQVRHLTDNVSSVKQSRSADALRPSADGLTHPQNVLHGKLCSGQPLLNLRQAAGNLKAMRTANCASWTILATGPSDFFRKSQVFLAAQVELA